jgi:hypothetical protein
LGSTAALLLGIGAGSADARIQDALIGHAATSTDETCFGHSNLGGTIGIQNTCGAANTTRLWDMALIWDSPNPSLPTITGKVSAAAGTSDLSCTHTVFDLTGRALATSNFPTVPRDGTYHTVQASTLLSVGSNQTSVVRCAIPGANAGRVMAVNY